MEQALEVEHMPCPSDTPIPPTANVPSSTVVVEHLPTWALRNSTVEATHHRCRRTRCRAYVPPLLRVRGQRSSPPGGSGPVIFHGSVAPWRGGDDLDQRGVGGWREALPGEFADRWDPFPRR